MFYAIIYKSSYKTKTKTTTTEAMRRQQKQPNKNYLDQANGNDGESPGMGIATLYVYGNKGEGRFEMSVVFGWVVVVNNVTIHNIDDNVSSGCPYICSSLCVLTIVVIL